MFRLFLVIIWGTTLFAFAACGPERDGKPEEDISLKLSEMNDQIREALLVNDFETADSLSAVVVEKAEEVRDYKALIEARMFKVTSHLDRRRLREGEAMLRDMWDLIEEHGTPRQRIRAFIQLSNFAFLDNRTEEGGELLDQAMSLVPNVDDPQVVGALHASRARAVTEVNPVEAIRLYYEALEKFDEAGELNNKAVVHNNIGLISHNQNDYEAALDEYAKALSINRQTGNQIQTAANYNNIANALSAMGRKEAAADTLLKAVMINQRMGISPGLIQNYYNLAQIYLDTDQLDMAYSFFSQAYEESRSINFPPGIMYHAVGLSDALFRKERYDEVPEYLDEAKRLAGQMNNLEVLARAWSIDAELNEVLGNYQQALTALREQISYVDQIDSLRRDREFEEVRARLELELKTAENELLRQQLSYRERLGRNQQLILISLVLGVLVTAILLLILFRNKSKLEGVNRSLKQKNQVITAKNIQLRDLNSELKHLNDEKSRLVGMIIHDLRNPLFAVIGFLELIDESLTDPAEKEHLKMAMNSATRLNQLINSLLEVHSLEKETRQMKLEQVPVDEIVSTAVTNFQEIARKKDIQLLEHISMIEAYSDPAYLSRIADNLISNAIKYSPRHSHVHVEVSVKGDHWELAVKDEGPGISKEDQANLYQMFGRLSAKPTGGEESTGLGLYTVKMLVGRLKGRIRLESEIGRGSRFICEFPVKPDAPLDLAEGDEVNMDSEPELETEDSAKF
jgi:signal transduction histidine kinase